jgi:hypothetical protein
MNRLAPAPAVAGDDHERSEPTGDRYLLPAHAHLVVYERDGDGQDRDGDGQDRDGDGQDRDGNGPDRGDDATADNTGDVSANGARGLITIYDCGAAQKPPSAQLLGELGSVRAACETTRNPTGYVVRMREPSVLVDVGDDRYVVRAR